MQGALVMAFMYRHLLCQSLHLLLIRSSIMKLNHFKQSIFVKPSSISILCLLSVEKGYLNKLMKSYWYLLDL